MAHAHHPDELEFEYNNSPLKLEGHEDYFSSYWVTDYPVQDFLGLIKGFEFPDDSPASIYTLEREQTADLSYGAAKSIAKEETVQFFRVDEKDGGLALTWTEIEDSGDQIVGVISDRDDVDLIKSLYRDTTETEIPTEDLREIDKFIDKHQP